MLKKGFTLAEVLLTLTIIGVVAAITMPALMTNVNDNVLEAQAKKFYSQLTDALDLYKQANEIDTLASGLNIPQFAGFFNTSPIALADVGNNLAAEYTNMRGSNNRDRARLFGIITEPAGDNPLYRLRDGSVFTIGDGPQDNTWAVTADVNGRRGPNQYGVDAWTMVIDINGRIRIAGNGGVEVSADNCLQNDTNGSCIAEFAANNFRFRQYRDTIEQGNDELVDGGGDGGDDGGFVKPGVRKITSKYLSLPVESK